MTDSTKKKPVEKKSAPPSRKVSSDTIEDLPDSFTLGKVKLIKASSSKNTDAGESCSAKVLKVNPFRKESFDKSGKESDNSVKSFSFVGEQQKDGTTHWYYAPLDSYEKKKLRVEESVVLSSAIAAQNHHNTPNHSSAPFSQFFLRFGSSNTFRQYITCPKQTVNNTRDPSLNVELPKQEEGRIESVCGQPVPQIVTVEATRYYEDSFYSQSDGNRTPTLALYSLFFAPEEGEHDPHSIMAAPLTAGSSAVQTPTTVCSSLPPKSPSSYQRSNPRLRLLKEANPLPTSSSTSTAFLSASATYGTGHRSDGMEDLSTFSCTCNLSGSSTTDNSTRVVPCVAPPAAPVSSRRPNRPGMNRVTKAVKVGNFEGV